MKGDYKAKEHYIVKYSKSEFANAKFILMQVKIFLLSLLVALQERLCKQKKKLVYKLNPDKFIAILA